MTGTQLTMAERAVAVQVAGQTARQGKLALDREMIELEAAQSDAALRRSLRIQSGAEVVAAVAMGIDPFSSASFATLATEQRRLMEESATNIRLNAMAAKGQITLEQANEFASTAAMIQQQGAFAIDRMNRARAQVSLAHQERMANYAVRVSDRGFAAGTQAMDGAWMAGASSLFGAYNRSAGVQEGVGKLYGWASGQIRLGYNALSRTAGGGFSASGAMLG
jgi:hypothetical protein